MIGDKTYLGDSVYCQFKGGGLVLTTEDDDETSNVIYLEPEVYDALLRYVGGLKQFAKLFKNKNLNAKSN